jgi:hypothetical protein
MSTERSGQVDPFSGASHAVALLVCERVIRDGDTNQFSIIGTFEGASPAQYPVTLPNLAVYAALGRGAAEPDTFFLALVSPVGEEIVWSAACQVKAWGPTGYHVWRPSLEGVTLKTPGVYRLRMYAADDRFLVERRFILHPAPGADDDDAPERRPTEPSSPFRR